MILLVLGVMKVLATSGTVGMHLDGGFYTDVALNVRDGLGFTTDMSLYHKGYTHDDAMALLSECGFSARRQGNYFVAKVLLGDKPERQ